MSIPATVPAKAHAKNRAPSGAKRWLGCPQSAYITPMYPNDETDASTKGDYWHDVMETTIMFGVVPANLEPDLDDAMVTLLEYVLKRFEEMGGRGKVRVYVEVQLDIPETGEFGTADIVLVSDREIEIIDLKSGYVPVHVRLNAQMMVYLLGCIAKYGERKKYTIGVFQPNYDHIDGPIRTDTVTAEDVEWMRGEIRYSIENADLCIAGKHCKETYCPHRGACEPFHNYCRTDLALGWHSSEVRSIDDAALARALDDAEQLAGWQKELRAEAMRRIMNMNRDIVGYKVVKARKQRAVLEPVKLVNAVHEKLGHQWAVCLFADIAKYLTEADFPVTEGSDHLKFLGSPKQVEDVIKQYAKATGLPRGGWQGVYANVVGAYIRETNSGLALEKAIDGRPAHKRGSEFTALAPLSPSTVVEML